jgi:hypothetical protein
VALPGKTIDTSTNGQYFLSLFFYLKCQGLFIVHPIIFELYRENKLTEIIANPMSIPRNNHRGLERRGLNMVMKTPCLTR